MSVSTFTTILKHRRILTSSDYPWRSERTTAVQGWYCSDANNTQEDRVGYIELENFNLKNVNISKIVFRGTAGSSGLGSTATKTLRFCEYDTAKTDPYPVGSALGTVSSTNLGGSATFEIELTSGTLFNNLANYFSSGRYQLTLYKPDDEAYNESYSKNYLSIAELEVEITYESEYTLTLNKGTGISSVSGSGSYAPGASVTISATPSTGYNFSSWTSTDGVQISNDASYTFTMPSADTTYTANATEKTYTVTYDKNGYTATNFPTTQTKTHGTTITLRTNVPVITTTNTESGYSVSFDASPGSCAMGSTTVVNDVSFTFLNWNSKPDGTGDEYNPGVEFRANQDTTLYLQVNKVISNGSITLPEATRDGYKHLGWIETTLRRVFQNGILSNGKLSSPLAIDYLEVSDEVQNYTVSDTATYGGYLCNNDGISVPVLYLQATNYSTPDHRNPFYYVGTQSYDGATYDVWKLIESDADWTSTSSLRIYTAVVTEQTDTSTVYTNSYTPTQDVTLYAVWESEAPEGLVYIDDGTGWNAHTIWIDDGTSWSRYVAYIDTGTGWVLYSG